MSFSSPEKNVLEFGFLPGQSIADFGAGSGHYTLALSRVVGDTGLIYAIDLKQDSLVRLKNMTNEVGRRNVEVLWGDIDRREGTGLKEQVVDGVVMSNILFQLRDKELAVHEAVRVLKVGGKLCVVEWSDDSAVSHVAGKTADDIVAETSARKLFENAGLVFERKFDAGEHHYGLIYSKVG